MLLSGTVIQLEGAPLNVNELPYKPSAHVVPDAVPELPFPDESATEVPVPSSNDQAPTRPLAT